MLRARSAHKPGCSSETVVATRPARTGGARRALGAAFISMLAPGTGHLYLGRRRRGVVMLGTTLAVVGGGLRVWLLDPVELLTLLVRPSVLLVLLAVDLLLLAFRLFAVVDAYRLGLAGQAPVPGAARRLHRLGAGAALALILVLTAAPHLVVGYYDLLTYDLLTEVFPARITPLVPSGGRVAP